ncbi:hypothetical protein [Microbacterium sp. RG1]|uniref:hypothetical protein n=1 Tax=Microbacterium sp. RG1 TaxID=2489212 RepID=UPI003FD5DC57
MSRGGVGVSVGVPGFGVGTGPRGNYIRTGQHGESGNGWGHWPRGHWRVGVTGNSSGHSSTRRAVSL